MREKMRPCWQNHPVGYTKLVRSCHSLWKVCKCTLYYWPLVGCWMIAAPKTGCSSWPVNPPTRHAHNSGEQRHGHCSSWTRRVAHPAQIGQSEWGFLDITCRSAWWTQGPLPVFTSALTASPVVIGCSPCSASASCNPVQPQEVRPGEIPAFI